MLSREEILKIAHLSRLDLSEKEISKFQKELSEILGFFEQLSEVNTDNVFPTAQVTGLKNQVREDVPQKFLANLLSCSSQKIQDHHISVPSVF